MKNFNKISTNVLRRSALTHVNMMNKITLVERRTFENILLFYPLKSRSKCNFFQQ